MRFPPEITKALVEKGLCASVFKAVSLSGGSINAAYDVETDQGHLFVKVSYLHYVPNDGAIQRLALMANMTPPDYQD